MKPPIKPPIKYTLKEPSCDVYGCGSLADLGTDGTEVDASGRTALPNLNVCNHHANWPHSEDAKIFAAGHTPKGERIDDAPDAYKLRAAVSAKKGA